MGGSRRLSLLLILLFASVAWADTGVNPETGRLDLTGFDVQQTDCSTVTTEGRSCWDTDGDTLNVGNGTTSTAIGSGGGGNAFGTIAVPAGTNPVADAAPDTLTLTETSPLVITGTASTDTIDITWTTLTVAEGGTGATSLTDGGILLGSGTGAITPLGVATNGQIPIGDGTTDPVLATLTGTANQVTVTNGAGSITLATPQDLATASTPTFGGLTLSAATAQLNMNPTSGDQFEWQCNSSECWYNNATDGTHIFRVNTDNSVDLLVGKVIRLQWDGAAMLPLEAAADSIPPIAKDGGANIDTLPADFDDSTDECRTVTFFLPPNIDASGSATFRIAWYDANAGGTCGSGGVGACDVIWYVETTAGARSTELFNTSLSTTTAAASTAFAAQDALTLTTWTATMSTLGWTTEAEFVSCEVCRDANNGSDDLVGDARVLKFAIDFPVIR